ncbi:MAG: hypothetical protein AB7T74_01640 [Clostridia bacterium]|jgi:hypothetical protein
MKLKRILIVAMVTVFILSGCASKPPATPEPEPAPPVAVAEPEPVVEPEPAPPEISEESLATLHAEVLAMRKNAFDLGLSTTQKDEYRTADGVYVLAKAALDKDDRPVAKEGLEEALELFTSLVMREAPLFTAEKADVAEEARNRAYASDAQNGSPVALAASEAFMSEARQFEAAEDYRSAIMEYMNAITAFDAAEKGSRASAVKARIDSLDFAALDPGNYQIASTKLSAVNSEVVNNPSAAQDAAEEALLRFNLALTKGWEMSAGSRRAKAEVYKTQSESIKAQVAVRDLYAEARAVWDTAAAAQAAGRHEEAAPLFDEAEGRFMVVYEIAAAKRAEAEAAMREATEKAAESSDILEQGDAILAGE